MGLLGKPPGPVSWKFQVRPSLVQGSVWLSSHLGDSQSSEVPTCLYKCGHVSRSLSAWVHVSACGNHALTVVITSCMRTKQGSQSSLDVEGAFLGNYFLRVFSIRV